MPAQRSMGAGLGLVLIASLAFGTSGTLARSLLEAGWSANAAVLARVAIASVVLAVPGLLALRGPGSIASSGHASIASSGHANNASSGHASIASSRQGSIVAGADGSFAASASRRKADRSRTRFQWHVLRRNLAGLGIFGVLAVAFAQVGFFNAVRYLPVGVALLIEYLGILLVVAWTWAVRHQRPGPLTLVGTASALGGLVLVLDISAGGLHPLGVLWGTVAALGNATYYIMSGRMDPRLPSVVLASGGMGVGAVILGLLGALGLAPMHASFGDVSLAGHRVSWLVPVLGLSFVAAALAYVVGIAGTRVLGSRLSSFVGLTEVPFAILIAWAVLGELPTLPQLLGGVFIIAGIAFVRADEQRPARREEEAASQIPGVVAQHSGVAA